MLFLIENKYGRVDTKEPRPPTESPSAHAPGADGHQASTMNFRFCCGSFSAIASCHELLPYSLAITN